MNLGVSCESSHMNTKKCENIDCTFISYARNNSTYQFLLYKFEIISIHKNMIMKSKVASLFEYVFPCDFNVDQVHVNECLRL